MHVGAVAICVNGLLAAGLACGGEAPPWERTYRRTMPPKCLPPNRRRTSREFASSDRVRHGAWPSMRRAPSTLRATHWLPSGLAAMSTGHLTSQVRPCRNAVVEPGAWLKQMATTSIDEPTNVAVDEEGLQHYIRAIEGPVSFVEKGRALK